MVLTDAARHDDGDDAPADDRAGIAALVDQEPAGHRAADAGAGERQRRAAHRRRLRAGVDRDQGAAEGPDPQPAEHDDDGGQQRRAAAGRRRRGRPRRPGWRARPGRAAASAATGRSRRRSRAVILPSAASLGTTWAKASYRAKIGMTRNAARSLPRRDRSSPARPVVTSRASVMQNSTCSSTASTRDDHAERAVSQPDGDAEQAEHVGQRPGAGRPRRPAGRPPAAGCAAGTGPAWPGPACRPGRTRAAAGSASRTRTR